MQILNKTRVVMTVLALLFVCIPIQASAQQFSHFLQISGVERDPRRTSGRTERRLPQVHVDRCWDYILQRLCTDHGLH